MATLPSEFIELAAELIGDEFAAFRKDASITKVTAFDYSTQTGGEINQVQPMIRAEYSQSQIDGTLIKTGDIMLIGEYQLFEWTPSPDNTTIIYDGESFAIRPFKIDPADATIIIQCRPI